MAANPYDQVAYPSKPIATSHPERLATLGMLHGMKPAPPAHCRVLELGCGAGGNLAPMALTLPDSEFVGIDLAPVPIERGREMVAACGLNNITLQQRDIRAVGAEFGSFDYIIAHGVYSWVPAEVRDRLLGICGDCLTPHGIAFVSFSAYPGAYHRRMVREMLLHHTRGATGPREQLAGARELLEFLAGAMPQPESYRAVVKQELTTLEQSGDDYYLHDALSEINDPIWFHEFAAHAAQHGLQYVADLSLTRTMQHTVPAEALARVRAFGAGGRLEREQYSDFLECRQFRRTLLCRQDVPVAEEPDPEQVRRLWVTAPAHAVSAQPDLRSSAVEDFALGSNTMKISDPLVKAAMCVLDERWPRALSFAELLGQARARIGGSDGQPADASQERNLAESLLAADAMDFVQLHSHVPFWAEAVSERPLASPLARWQVNQGRPVTNVWHRNIALEDPLLRRLLALLDGTRGRGELVRELIAFMKTSGIVLRHNRQAITDRGRLSRVLAGALDDNLAKFADNCLLIG